MEGEKGLILENTDQKRSNIELGLPKRKNDQEVDKRINERINIKSLKEKMKEGCHCYAIESLARLVVELEDKIPNYDTILSDEASGRLPSLFLRQIINRKRRESGNDPVNTYFLAWGKTAGSERARAVENFINQKKGEIRKALLVTDYIYSGESLNKLAQLLEAQGINFDIAAVSIAKNPDNEEFKDKKDIIKRLKYGEISDSGEFAFYRKSAETGVVKVFDSDSAHPKVYRGFSSKEYLKKAKNEKGRLEIKEEIEKDLQKKRNSREDMSLLADELYKLLE